MILSVTLDSKRVFSCLFVRLAFLKIFGLKSGRLGLEKHVFGTRDIEETNFSQMLGFLRFPRHFLQVVGSSRTNSHHFGGPGDGLEVRWAFMVAVRHSQILRPFCG